MGLFEYTVTLLIRSVWDNVLIHHKIRLVRRTKREKRLIARFREAIRSRH